VVPASGETGVARNGKVSRDYAKIIKYDSIVKGTFSSWRFSFTSYFPRCAFGIFARDIFVDLCEKICGRAAASLFTFHYGNWLKKASYAYGIVRIFDNGAAVNALLDRACRGGSTRRVIDPFSTD